MSECFHTSCKVSQLFMQKFLSYLKKTDLRINLERNVYNSHFYVPLPEQLHNTYLKILPIFFWAGGINA